MCEEIKAAHDIVTGIAMHNKVTYSTLLHLSCASFSENKDYEFPYSIGNTGELIPAGNKKTGLLSHLRCNKCGAEYLIIKKNAG